MRTPRQEINKRYEDKHKAERKAKNGTFSTSIPRSELKEIIEFLDKYKITKVELVRQGYLTLQDQIKGSYDCK